ncbi:MAG: asparagine synthase (glutamine-hydrolyzing) [Nanoarchaeota archaeon]|nr:asparagine synthase (glutamine-hydrolyzing) [Nanoarchaeota archaeon]
MCGIFGFSWEDKALLERMSRVLFHRGPDEFASYGDKGISLGMRRLAIIDLKKGLYPITNENGTIQVIFNGEIYNYQELKKDLEARGHRFTTSCDAEVIPHAYEEYGDNFPNKFNGMFAIALYDIAKNRILLVRDKLGEKPLYYLLDKNRLAFASEIKCLLEIPEYTKSIDRPALDSYLTHRYTLGTSTLFQNIKRMSPGTTLAFDGNIKITRYWNLDYKENTNTLSQNAGILRYLLEDSVKMRLMSDVPLGAYLSGGLDSSAIVALMAKHSDKVNTFNVSFSDSDFDESKYARIVAERFSTNHTQINVDIDATKVLPEVIWHLDEPIADAATIPTYLMSKETRKKVTVVLSGEGSDELFGGYERFRHLGFAYNFRHIPTKIRELPKNMNLKDKTLVRGSELLSNLHDDEKAYISYYSVFDDKEKKELYMHSDTPKSATLVGYFKEGFLTGIQKIDIEERLPNNMLLKGDKMTMAASIEGRVPFLDPRLAEHGVSIPFGQKASLTQEKIVYREAVKGLIPKEILSRKKQGFSVPTEKWAKDGLIDRLQETIKDTSEPFLKKDAISHICNNLHKSIYYRRQFWAVLMYEEWYSKFMQ